MVPRSIGHPRMATGLWKRPGVPQKGWTCVDTDDLRADDPEADLAICEMCEVQEIRYVHRMRHPDYAAELDVGCVCAEKMEDDYKGPRRREAPLRSRAARRSKWLKRKWKRSERGNDYIKSDGYRVTVFRVDRAGRTGWGGTIVDVATDKATRSRKVHASSDAAKLAAFDTIEIFRSKGMKSPR
jgi:hypothetical protein